MSGLPSRAPARAGRNWWRNAALAQVCTTDRRPRERHARDTDACRRYRDAYFALKPVFERA